MIAENLQDATSTVNPVKVKLKPRLGVVFLFELFPTLIVILTREELKQLE
jgi:hypothetical protein